MVEEVTSLIDIGASYFQFIAILIIGYALLFWKIEKNIFEKMKSLDKLLMSLGIGFFAFIIILFLMSFFPIEEQDIGIFTAGLSSFIGGLIITLKIKLFSKKKAK